MAKQFVATGMGCLPFSMKREYEIIKKENVSINSLGGEFNILKETLNVIKENKYGKD